jgi:hypothetical protein
MVSAHLEEVLVCLCLKLENCGLLSLGVYLLSIYFS